MRLLEREPTLHTHLRDVGRLSVDVGRLFALDSEELDELRRAAELHDARSCTRPSR
jgi:response regulator RpfG family c-di-GMP phosphodiesterase